MILRPLGAIHLVADLDVVDATPGAEDRIRALLAAGLPSLQLRAVGRTTAARVRRGRPLAKAAREAGATFVVNGDVEAALALEADGLHLPAGAAPPAEVRLRLPPGMLVGASAHDAGERARARGGDWVLVSPVFPTPSKPGARPLGPEGLAALVSLAPAPVYALGGIDVAGAASCFRAGAAGVAAIRALLGPGGEVLIREARQRAERG